MPRNNNLWPSAALAPAILVLCLAAAPLALGLPHPGPQTQLGELNELISESPDDAALYLQRAHVLRELSRYPEALADFDRALELDSTQVEAHLGRGQLYLEADRPAAAEGELRTYLTVESGSARGLLFLARSLAAQSLPADAVEAYGQFVETSPKVRPEYRLEYARALRLAGELEAALQVLDEGLESQPTLTALAEMAVDLELENGSLERALERLSRLAASSPRAEIWHLRRAELLLEAGDRAASEAALESAREALARRSHGRRTSGSSEGIDARLRELELELELLDDQADTGFGTTKGNYR